MQLGKRLPVAKHLVQLRANDRIVGLQCGGPPEVVDVHDGLVGYQGLASHESSDRGQNGLNETLNALVESLANIHDDPE